jgi:hypothetical protein
MGMDVCVLSRDLMFFTAVEGVAGAMGHRARQAETLADVGAPDVLIADFAFDGFDVGAVAAAGDPLRTAIFAPHGKVEVFTGAHANGIAHVYRRGALATELPRLLAEYAAAHS